MSSDYQTDDGETGSPGGGLAITDVYYVLFRRKWLVLLGAVLGVTAACGLWKLRQPLHKSEAKLLVKYVVETPVIVATGTPVNIQNPDESGTGILISEIEILQSVDNLQQVARTVGPERILPKGANPSDVDRAAGLIGKKLKAVPLQKSKIILLEFQHASAEIAQQVLREVIKAYLKKHDDIHRALGVSDASLFQRRDELKTNFTAVVDRLKVLKEQAGVHSLEEGKSAKTKRENGILDALFAANADLARLRASLDELIQQGMTSNVPTATSEMVPPDKIQEHRSLTEQIAALNRTLQANPGLTPAAPVIATNLAMLQAIQRQRTMLESNWPGLLRLTQTPVPLALLPPTMLSPVMNVSSLKVEVKALESKTAELTNQLALIRGELKKIGDVEAEMTELEQRKANVEKEMAVVGQTINQASFNANLRDRQNTSISPFQEPSPPYKDYGKLLKNMVMAVAGGLMGGLALAFIVELVLVRTIKRPKDIEGILEVPLFLSIPVLRMRSRPLIVGGNGKPSATEGASANPGGKDATSGAVMKAPPPQQDSEMKSYHDALRDRLVTHFDVRDMTHKPKLIAVTGCSPGSGVSSVATGLAASLSETGDGNVLLVDMKGQKGSAHAFFHGKPACGLAEALENETRNSAQVDQNLYVVAAGSVDQKLQRIIPQQFSQFVPKLKASDYDYIIFDMPPVAQTSITAKVARFMDMVLMVVESERTDRDVAKRATTLLTESKASVAAVLNKRRRYVPSWLLEEFH
jgi:Mrp family chromosome partitioning ATPase/uncharacterized protein involved in exopolysaccharide biosynthesis